MCVDPLVLTWTGKSALVLAAVYEVNHKRFNSRNSPLKMGECMSGSWSGLVEQHVWLGKVCPGPERLHVGGEHGVLLHQGEIMLVLVVGVVFNFSPQGVMVARGEVATWVTVSDPWVSGVLQAVQLCAIGPKV